MEQLNQSGVYLCSDIVTDIQHYIEKWDDSQIYILTDTTTNSLCLPVLREVDKLKNAQVLAIKPTDEFKNLEALADIWRFLGKGKATRKSLLINLGGGMVSDIGGFAGCTYKRGLTFLNIPTTLLSVVDAAVGGKTGINFDHLKNQIGIIRQPENVFIDIQFLKTLDRDNLLSGYAEMLKHALISDKAHWEEIMDFDLVKFDLELLKPLMWKSVAVKERVVDIDPNEQGIRKALNLGHTIGHAMESISHEKKKPVLHGTAVAAGLIPELYLSYKKLKFPEQTFNQAVNYIVSNYTMCPFEEVDFEEAYELMTHDKKNEGDRINFTLLEGIGKVQIDTHCTKEEILESLQFYLDVYKK